MTSSVQRQYALSSTAVWLSRKQLLAMFCIGLALLGWIAVEANRELARAANARFWVSHTALVIERTMNLQDAIAQMASDQRLLLINHDEAARVASRDASFREAKQVLAALQQLTRDNPGQQLRLEAISRSLASQFAAMREAIASRQQSEIAAAPGNVRDASLFSLIGLRQSIAEIDRTEAALLESRSNDAALRSGRLGWLLLVASALGMLLLGTALFVLLRQLQRSERMAAELDRANTDARHALALVDATHDGVFIYDADTFGLSYVNQGGVNQLGYSRAELLGMTALDFKRAFDADTFRKLLAPLMAGSVDSLAFETFHRCKDGSLVPVEVSMRHASFGDEAPSLVTIARDIRARRQAENDRDRFFDLSLDMLCIASADGYFKRLSPAFTRTLGWSVDELLSRPLIEFVHPDDRDATMAEVERQVIAGEAVLQFENRYLHKDGSWRVLSWKSTPEEGGRMYATARDVTERHADEQRIVALNRDLSERQVALETANKELEAFSYSVSHDLRAPLRHIDGYARMLEEDAADALSLDARRYLKTIIDSARRMGVLIDDLLALSRLGRKPLTPQNVDMQELVERAMREVAHADARGVHGLAIEATLPSVRGDPALLLQVWINLLSNAVKYSAPRGDAARIVVAGSNDGERVRYTVSDNGVGFDMRYADKLFGVFQRLHAQDQFEGTGVGLAIVQRIVHRHDGRVSAMAEPDRGACFAFELPVVEEAA